MPMYVLRSTVTGGYLSTSGVYGPLSDPDISQADHFMTIPEALNTLQDVAASRGYRIANFELVWVKEAQQVVS